MSIHRSVKIAAACALLAAGSAHAQTAKDYNVFVFGDFTASGSDVEGRLAAGGDVSISGYSVGEKLGSAYADSDNLVAGGKLSFNNGRLVHGNAVGGSLNVGSSASFGNGAARADSTGIDFAAEQLRMLGLSSTLASEAETGAMTWQYGGYTLTGSGAALDIFNVSGANLSGANSFNISASKDAFVVINVSGVADMFHNLGINLTGIAADHVLFNFYEAKSLTIEGISIKGSILAPQANVNFNSGQFNGTLIANSMTGGGQFNYDPYAGTLLDPAPTGVPEPAAWGMMIGGFALAGAALRRRKRGARAFA